MRLFSTEQISKYHSDKACDQVSDALLTAYLKGDHHSHCGIETMWKGDTVILAGEVSSHTPVNRAEIVKRVADKLGYKATNIIDLISEQSPEIGAAVDGDDNIGAGDQGMMYGYACSDTLSRLPFGFDLANRIIAKLESCAFEGVLKGDAKTQVTVDLDKCGMESVNTILISACHNEEVSVEDVREYLLLCLATLGVPSGVKFILNPSGAWTFGGPSADAGLTGRKIVCDQYGGYCAVGGGAFSGKDPSKVDRSASYMARHIAKDFVDQELADECQVQLAYAIGIAEPVSVGVKASLKGDALSEEYNRWLAGKVRKEYDLTPRGIIKALDLYNKDYEKIAEGCHYR